MMADAGWRPARLPAWMAILPMLLLAAEPVDAQGGPGEDRCKLLATNWGTPTASLWDIDIVTGAASNQRNDASFTEQAVGLTRAAGGAFYGLGIGGTLYKIEPVTAAVTTVGALGIFPPEGGIDFDPTTGVLYGINEIIGSERGIYTIAPGTGAATVIGATQLGDLSAVALDASGTLYVLDTINDELLTVDKGNGGVLTAVNVSFDFDFIAGMDFHPETGELYVGEGGSNSPYSLFTLNTSTGVATEIGVTGLVSSTGGISGLQFNCPQAPPLPALHARGRLLAIFALVAAGIASICLHGRAHRPA